MNYDVAAALVKYFEYVASLEHSSKPDYSNCRKLLQKGLKDCKSPVEGKLEFTSKGLGRKLVRKQIEVSSEGDGGDPSENEALTKRTPRKNQAKVSKNNIILNSDSDDDSSSEQRYKNQATKKRTRRNQTKVPKENMDYQSSDSVDDSDSEEKGYVNQVYKKRTQRRNRAKMPKENVNNLS